MSKRMRIVLLGALASVAIYGGACGTSAPVPVAIDPALADVVFVGRTTASASEALLAPTPITDPVQGPGIDSPPDQTLLEKATVPTFSWHAGGASALLSPGEGAPALLPAPAVQPATGAWPRALVGPERSAHAESAPLSGAGYMLLFSTDKMPRLLRVFTTGTSFTPDARAWATLVSAGTWTKLTIVSGAFVLDHLIPKTGPFVGKPIEFCIEE